MPLDPDGDPAALLGRAAHPRLLDAPAGQAPADVGRPAAPPARGRRSSIVLAIGATLTGLSLLAGIALLGVGVVEAIAGGHGVLVLLALAAGAVLLATHWGWVHVAEATAQALDRRGGQEARDRRERWLAAIEPYTRHEVSTHVLDDGSISIVRRRYRPVPAEGATFAFAVETEAEEVHSGEQAGAAIAERAETLRREAALDTARERSRFEQAADARRGELIAREHAQDSAALRRAESRALSDRLNARLRDPPLSE